MSVLTDNGGKTPTHQLLPDSPAIDKGLALEGLPLDQTGRNRLRPDLGSYESRKTDSTQRLVPTLDPINVPTPVDHSAGPQVITLTGIRLPGVTNPVLAATALSSNLAVVSGISVILKPNGQAELTYSPVSGSKGNANITVTLFSPGFDGTFGSIDDTQVQRSFAITITNSQANPSPILTIASQEIFEPRENSAAMTFALALSAASLTPISARFKTVFGTANANDLVEIERTVLFEPGEVTKTVDVMIKSDAVLESTEKFTVQLDQVVGATLATPSADGTIYDSPIVIGHPILPTISQNPHSVPVVIVVVHTIGPTTPEPPVVRKTTPRLVGRLLATELQMTDVDRNGMTELHDAIILIDLLNTIAKSSSDVVAGYGNALLAYDVNRDTIIAPLDALLIINLLNLRMQQTSGEGESGPAFKSASAAFMTDPTIFDELQEKRRRASFRRPAT